MACGSYSISKQYAELSANILPATQGKQLIIILNKQDIVTPSTLTQAQNYLNSQLSTSDLDVTLLSLSAQKSEGIDQLHQILTATLLKLQSATTSAGTIVSNLRHYEALRAALTAIDRVIDGLDNGLSGDFISQDLRECISTLAILLARSPPMRYLAIFSKISAWASNLSASIV